MDNPLLFKNQQSQYLLYQKLIELQPVDKELSLYHPKLKSKVVLINNLIMSFFPGAELGIITVGEQGAHVNIEPTVVREANREGLHGRIPYRLLNDREACLSCGLEKAKALLNSNDMGAIIVVSALKLPELILNDSTEEADQNNFPVPIHQVFFEDGNRTVATVTGSTFRNNGGKILKSRKREGALFKVPKTPRLLQSLSSIFLSVLKVAKGPQIECTYQRFYHFDPNTINGDEDNYEVVTGNSITGIFTVEKELSTDLWVVLTPSPGMENDIEVFEITSPSGQRYVFPQYGHGIVYFHFEAQNNEAGVWTFEAKMHPIVTKTLGSMVSLEVFGQQSSSGNNAVTLDFWTAPSRYLLSYITSIVLFSGRFQNN